MTDDDSRHIDFSTKLYTFTLQRKNTTLLAVVLTVLKEKVHLSMITLLSHTSFSGWIRLPI